MKQKYILLLIVISIFCFNPLYVKARDYNFVNSSSIVYKLDDDIDIGFNENDYNQDKTCDSLLGDPTKDDSVAWLIQEALNILKVLGPIIVLVLSGFDFVKVILSGDEKAMKEAQKKLGVRLILVACLFALPSIVMWLLDFFHFTNSTCGIN